MKYDTLAILLGCYSSNHSLCMVAAIERFSYCMPCHGNLNQFMGVQQPRPQAPPEKSGKWERGQVCRGLHVVVMSFCMPECNTKQLTILLKQTIITVIGEVLSTHQVGTFPLLLFGPWQGLTDAATGHFYWQYCSRPCRLLTWLCEHIRVNQFLLWCHHATMSCVN